jgi:SAM-dependent methyltransferase
MTEQTLSISKISASDGTRTNAKYGTWKHVIPLPPDSLMWSVGGATIENFIVVGDAWAQVVSRYTQENTTLLDIGCGCGRTARVLSNNRWISKYIGFDVIPENVEWCKRYIAPNWHGSAEFHLFDLYSGEYNPNGAIKAQDVRFPCGDGDIDLVFAASVFTHLLEPDAIHYLAEVSRSLSARGYAVLSIHNNVPAGYRFYGTEARIEIESDYFRQLAGAAGLKEVDRIDDLAGQQAFIFMRG